MEFAKTLKYSWWIILLVLMMCQVDKAMAQDQPMKIEARLVWCTDQDKPKDSKKIKDLDARLLEKLRNLKIFKWRNFFEMDNQKIRLPHMGSNITSLSHDCVVEVKHLGGCQVEVKLYGEAKLVQTIRQPLPKGEYLIIAGDIKKKENEIWIVVLSIQEGD